MPVSLQHAVLATLDAPVAAHPLRVPPPAADEHDPYYARYIALVPAGDLAPLLRRQVDTLHERFGAMRPEQAEFAYAPGKWTLKEVLGHVTDTERLFTYRALSIARGDAAPLPGMSQDEWMSGAPFAGRSLPSLLAEWTAVRAATIAFVDGLPADAWTRRGVASERPFSVNALLHVVAGHVEYHLAHTRETYMGAKGWPA